MKEEPVNTEAMAPTENPLYVELSRRLDEQRTAILAALAPADSALVRHARFELERAGELGGSGSYGGMVGRAALELVAVLASQGHSGGSVGLTLALFDQLARFDVLSPLTSHPGEWVETPHAISGDGVRTWQNRRKPSVFWREGEETWYDLDAPVKAERI